ncbi:methyltransferase N6AMT1-like, partial [Haliotis rubra]|uniref:methyltransferase N6AMT1-like n=1 Tax=Haliotis rubra TaxID=36100 RepID=UPI001EE5B03A
TNSVHWRFQVIEILDQQCAWRFGSGSGVCITFLARMLGPTSVYMSTDINVKAACITSRDTATRNSVTAGIVIFLRNISLNIVKSLLFLQVNCLSSRLSGCIDVLLFNPPSRSQPSQEVGSTDIEASWAGGIRGREVVDRLFPLVSSILSPEGVFYLVIIKENNQGDDRLEQTYYFCIYIQNNNQYSYHHK